MSNDRYYSGLKEVKRAKTEDECNRLLAQGWEMLKPGVEINGPSTQTEVHYVLGRFADSNPAASAQPQQRSQPSVSVQEILGLHWEPSTFKGVDAWVPSAKVPQKIVDYFKAQGKRTDKGSYGLDVGDFDMYLGPTGNLQRYKKR